MQEFHENKDDKFVGKAFVTFEHEKDAREALKLLTGSDNETLQNFIDFGRTNSKEKFHPRSPEKTQMEIINTFGDMQSNKSVSRDLLSLTVDQDSTERFNQNWHDQTNDITA